MEREIKFRAWSKNRDVHFMATQGEEDIKDLQSFIFHYGDEKILMQFTGLLDKKGNEVYEGDIIDNGYSIEWNSIHNSFCYFTKSGCVSEILSEVYNDDGVIINPYINREVIGNVYENPELLTN